jgi:solute:Na+ symporter, SSS family
MIEKTFTLHPVDLLAFFGYLVLLGFVGWWYGRKKTTSQDYFLAGRSLPWYVVGSSYIASNISIEHFVGMVGAAVLFGLCVATPEWSTVIAFSFMIWIFIPFLLTSKVYTAPEFLERRFNTQMRLIFAIITILANIFLFMGPVIYGGSLILVKLAGLSKVSAAIIIGIVAGGWAIWGGLKSVAFMDVVTIIFKIGGGMIVTVLGLMALGDGNMIAGWHKMVEINFAKDGWAAEWVAKHAPNLLQGATEGTEYHRMSVIQPLNHTTNPWTHWIFSFFYIGLWYTVINQFLIQKVLAAKDIYHARMGMVFASFLKLLVPVVVVLPGLIYFAMRPDFLMGDDWRTIGDEANNTYIVMVRDLVPPLLLGVLMAAFFSAIQSTVCGALNSTSTIFTLDIYQRYINPNQNDRQSVKMGRVTGVIILFLSIGFAVLLGTAKTNLFVFIQAGYAFIGPAFSAIFLLGVMWKRVSGKDAIISVIAAFSMSIFLKYLEFGPLVNSTTDLAKFVRPFGNQALITWAFTMMVCCISAMVTAPPKPEQVGEGLVFSFKDKKALWAGLGTRWYNSVILWWSLAFGGMVALVVIFSVFVK